MDDAKGLAIAFEEAKISYDEGGIPIGAALIAADGTVLGRGHNMRMQLGNPILHVSTPNWMYHTQPGETSALQNAGRLPASSYKGATMYTTLSPCDMCTGACLLYDIKRVVLGENKTFLGADGYLKQRGVEVVVLDDEACRGLMEKFIQEKPDVWNEDIGVEERVYSKEDIKRPSA
ncbi:hypothetical protein PG988_008818 [Apiospora saccharicola]